MKLMREFYKQDTVKVARALLGKTLVHIIDGERLSGMIVETEAYLGTKDLASHARKGLRTPRNESMYLEAGHSYIYRIYGIHYCFNVVTKEVNRPEAVLIRALEPREGLRQMRLARPVSKDILLTNGPGKLCQSLQITKSINGVSLIKSGEFFIEQFYNEITPFKIIKAPRIGVAYAGEWSQKPLRFYIDKNPFVSIKKSTLLN